MLPLRTGDTVSTNAMTLRRFAALTFPEEHIVKTQVVYGSESHRTPTPCGIYMLPFAFTLPPLLQLCPPSAFTLLPLLKLCPPLPSLPPPCTCIPGKIPEACLPPPEAFNLLARLLDYNPATRTLQKRHCSMSTSHKCKWPPSPTCSLHK